MFNPHNNTLIVLLQERHKGASNIKIRNRNEIPDGSLVVVYEVNKYSEAGVQFDEHSVWTTHFDRAGNHNWTMHCHD